MPASDMPATDWFAALRPEIRRALTAAGRPRRLEAGSSVYRAGDPGDGRLSSSVNDMTRFLLPGAGWQPRVKVFLTALTGTRGRPPAA